MAFLTSNAEISQSDEKGLFYTAHNQLYKDDDVIYIVPRYMKTDGYTIPNWLTWLGGGKTEWDMRPSIQHDFDCRYHQTVVVNLTEDELRKRGYLRHHEKKIGDETFLINVCEDIPICFLAVKDVAFKGVNDKFKRCLKAIDLKKWRVNMMRFAVNFNVGWIYSGKEKIDLYKFYKDFV